MQTVKFRWSQSEIDLMLKLREKQIPVKDLVRFFPNRTLRSLQIKASELNWSEYVYHQSYNRTLDNEIINKKFGKVVALREVQSKRGSDGKLRRMFKCRCDFGHIVFMELRRLTHSKNCFCDLCGQKGSNHNKWKGFEEISGTFFKRIRKGAQERNIEFDIKIEEIWSLFLKQERKCALSNLVLKFGVNKYESDATASLDRIDSSLGYTLENIQWVHKDINIMKMDYNQKYFIEMCKLIAKNN